ncbi:ABC transporter permease [Bacillus sp. NTK071]|uniref:ABC transporter permease n=1 Tax=Bacillus sp. NTK071 TaxID=2802175 RepID=UPI001A8CB8BF|nr:ABC transporter permease [Bacillus sp. NTK071]MBN8210911.1 ABC transporter permease [Bacillus sp. NTK071]
MGNFKTVLGFHLREALTAKSFTITASILFLVIMGFFAVTHFSSDEDRDTIHVLVESDFYNLDVKALNDAQSELEFIGLESNQLKEMEELVRKGKEDGIVKISEGEGPPKVEYFFKRMPDFNLVALLQPTLQEQYLQKAIVENDVSIDTAKALMDKVVIEQSPLKETESTGLVYFFLLLMYMFIIMFGQLVSMAVVGEKTTRVMEIMITKVKPLSMMYAKILSAMSAGVLQIVIVGFAYLLAVLLGWTEGEVNLMGLPIDLSVLSVKMFLFFILYFVLGYVLYALIFASVASVVSRVEEVGSIIFPVSMMLIGAILLGFRSMLNPNDTLVLVGSYIPFFSPLVTFSRIVLEEAQVIEIIGSLAILITTIVLLSIFSSRIYKNGVMRYQAKATIKDVLKLARRES